MKKFFCILIAVFISLSIIQAYADGIDISGMSYDELIKLQAEVNKAIWASDGWKEVEVPVGVFEVGKEIPAGKWTIKKATNNYTYFRVGKRFVKGEVEDYSFTSDLESEINLILDEGTYVEISYYPVIFTPYVASFSFN